VWWQNKNAVMPTAVCVHVVVGEMAAAEVSRQSGGNVKSMLLLSP